MGQSGKTAEKSEKFIFALEIVSDKTMVHIYQSLKHLWFFKKCKQKFLFIVFDEICVELNIRKILGHCKNFKMTRIHLMTIKLDKFLM